MKRITTYFTPVCLTLLMLASCQLDEQVYSSIYTANFYKTGADAQAAITAAYDPIADMYSGPAAVLVPDFSADQTYPRAAVSRNALTLFTYDVNYTAQRTAGRLFESPQQIWISCYDGIEKANWVIEKVPGASMDAARKKEIIGEAFFLRAFYHWMATKNFGEVIIKIKPSDVQANAYVPKSAIADVYKQIYQDLDSAVVKLPTHTASLVKGRASKEAALALYAKAALYNQDWATSLSKAQAVMTNAYLMLMPNVLDIYDVTKEDVARVENIFAFESESNASVSGSTSARSHQMVGLCGPPGSNGPAYGLTTFGSFFAYQSFFNSFDPTDKRRALLDTTYIDKTGKTVPQKSITPITKNGVLVKKYMDPFSTTGNTNNIPIFRMADVYLIAAEAEAHLNGPTTAAYDYADAVRHRAGLGDLTAGLSQQAFIDAVLQERSWEFFAEGDRWYDLTRTDKFMTVIPLAVSDYYPVRTPQPKNKYFPIPQDELNANTLLTQNDPWK
ncbi:RagB/SusD family nutrient uptake outer membrane protein [Chryseolinea soli]|uniref:RagB/SusD family nutrient uptake outer membrane protein n=1 Tax=Chryseolinea soli TaxID=2321403 RepID=A0A385SPY7_9BACT|nr:RagB/SusD family nutrient uptake outer membrane protein [Chryseolinea soli]AYB31570.1 RagB/SusD family nutrient uptake outer membrane protein [Chryseolinea soli]